MDYIAEAKNIKISPRKVRLVADSISALSPSQAIVTLKLMNKRAATPIQKAIQSAVANAVNNFKANADSLVLKELYVNEGVSYKRFHYAGRGRMRPYKKRTSHIRVVLSAIAGKSTALVPHEAEKAAQVAAQPAEKQTFTKKLATAVSTRMGRGKKGER